MNNGVQRLNAGWRLADTAAGTLLSPQALEAADLRWQDAVVPGTVAQSLKTGIGELGNFDSRDWWYRCDFAAPASSPGALRFLHFGGLATLADVWLNGELLLSARNMFVAHDCDVTSLLKPQNELVIRFRALEAELAVRKPRPRWKTALVAHQNLRWVRTTLLGRIPGWSPPITPVGPWKEIRLDTFETLKIESISLQTGVRNTSGWIQVAAKIQMLGTKPLRSATLHVGDHAFPLTLSSAGPSETRLSGNFELPDAPLWWPHTHGEPRLQNARLALDTGSALPMELDCGRIGFKKVTMNRAAGQVQIRINDIPVFCRGACWTVSDILSLTGTGTQLKDALLLAQESGLNMLRVGGTMTYESDEFYRLCDELGIMVWQDFMFANMDYPVLDPVFRAEIEHEARYQLDRLHTHPSVTVYCGGSEVQQQSAMMGFPRSEWSNDFFDQTLPGLCEQLHPSIPYFPSSPCEGALPFHLAAGISHYYGVGAYRRPLTDVKHAQVKFTPECLGFSNVPDAGQEGFPAPHHPAWKARVPRDSGAGWDFEDIRDFYLKELFGLDPVALRSQDVERYFELSRVVTGHVMKTVFAEWRKPGSVCGGGLVWFFNDLWPGAGWGVIDSSARPKAVWHDLKRAWAGQALLITDEGLDGLQLHVLNETAQPLKAIVGFELYGQQRIRTAAPERSVEVPARGGLTLQSDELLGYFADVTDSYRFGPSKYDVVRGTLRCAETQRLLSEDFYFPQGLNLQRHELDGVEATVTASATEGVTVTLRSKCFLQNVQVAAKGYKSDDNYFHLAPGVEKQILFLPAGNAAPSFKAELSAINLRGSLTLRAAQQTGP